MNRRELLMRSTICLPTLFISSAPVSAQTPSSTTLCTDAASIISSGDPFPAVPTGTLPPTTKDRITGFRILANAPTGKSPYEVAKYFAEITEKGSGGPFNQEWEKFYNPVIFGFLAMTLSAPFKGDETHWCAAFVNYCLLWAKREGTQSHASASFRAWTAAKQTGTSSPKEGDLAVFKNIGLDGKATVYGHVAFYKSMDVDENKVHCLGGNQGGGSFNGGAVIYDDYPIKRAPTETEEGRELVGFVSIEKVPKTAF